jgi:hypothetical protein
MITAPQIITFLEEVTYKKDSCGNPMPVSCNISHWSKSISNLKEFTRTKEFKEFPWLRFFVYLPDTANYTWCAYQSTHTEVFDKFYNTNMSHTTICGVIDTGHKVFCTDMILSHIGRFNPYDSNIETLWSKEVDHWEKGINWLRQYLSGLDFKLMHY